MSIDERVSRLVEGHPWLTGGLFGVVLFATTLGSFAIAGDLGPSRVTASALVGALTWAAVGGGFSLAARARRSGNLIAAGAPRWFRRHPWATSAVIAAISSAGIGFFRYADTGSVTSAAIWASVWFPIACLGGGMIRRYLRANP